MKIFTIYTNQYRTKIKLNYVIILIHTTNIAPLL